MSAGLALQHVVDRANLRASHLLTVHAARTNPLDLISGLGGYPLVVSSVERLAVDMSEAIDCWRKLRLSASPELTATATEVLNALAHRIGQVDPGWIRPRKRRSYRSDEALAVSDLTRQTTRLDLLVRLEAAPQRSARRAARRDLREFDEAGKPPVAS